MAVDWTGARVPVKNRAIALAVCARGADAPRLVPGPHSRADIADFILHLARGQSRVLVGMDCNFGFAAAVAARHIGPRYNAAQLWARIDAVCADDANFYAEKFWTHPHYGRAFWAAGPCPPHMRDMPRRMVETACADAGLGRPESPFKLIGAKQVGKGGLAAMRMAHFIKQHAGDAVCFWPFENDTPVTRVIVTEIYPRLFLKMAGFGNRKIRTRADLAAALAFFGAAAPSARQHPTDHDADALVSVAGLRALCGVGRDVPSALVALPDGQNTATIRREGWIFGVPAR